MTLQQLIYFEKISDTQNMSRAAEELYITQPSLSVSMQGQRIEFHPLPSGVYYRYNCLTLRPGDAPAGAAADRFVQFMSERRVE